jgi:polyferredoxin
MYLIVIDDNMKILQSTALSLMRTQILFLLFVVLPISLIFVVPYYYDYSVSIYTLAFYSVAMWLYITLLILALIVTRDRARRHLII